MGTCSCINREGGKDEINLDGQRTKELGIL